MNITRINLTTIGKPTADMVALAWNTIIAASTYRIYQSTRPFAEMRRVGTTSEGYYQVKGLKPETIYYFEIRAYDSDSLVATSNKIMIRTSDSKAPTNLKLKINENNVVELTFDEMEEYLGYYVLKAQSSEGPFMVVARINENRFIDNDITPNMTYYYKVRGYNNEMTGPESETVNITIPQAIIEPPTNLKGQSVSPTSVALNWKASTTKGIEGYRIYRSNEENGVYLNIGETPDTTFTDNGLLPDTTYYYEVEAYDKDTHSTLAGPVAVTTTQRVIGEVKAYPVGDRCIRVFWTQDGITDTYRVLRSRNPNGEFTEIGTVVGSANTYTDCNLAPFINYFYQVIAIRDGAETVIGVSTGTMVSATDNCCRDFVLYIPNACGGRAIETNRNNTRNNINYF